MLFLTCLQDVCLPNWPENGTAMGGGIGAQVFAPGSHLDKDSTLSLI